MNYKVYKMELQELHQTLMKLNHYKRIVNKKMHQVNDIYIKYQNIK